MLGIQKVLISRATVMFCRCCERLSCDFKSVTVLFFKMFSQRIAYLPNVFGMKCSKHLCKLFIPSNGGNMSFACFLEYLERKCNRFNFPESEQTLPPDSSAVYLHFYVTLLWTMSFFYGEIFAAVHIFFRGRFVDKH